MRTLSTPTTALVTAQDTAPAYLVLVDFDSGPVRWCTRETVTWAGQTWLGASLTVEPPTDTTNTGRLVFTDPDALVHALIFAGAFKSRAVDIWKFWGAALATDDPVHMGRCVTAGADSAQGKRTINLVRHRATLLQSPRQIIGPSIGVNYLAAPGEQIAWGAAILTLEVPNG